MHNVRMISTDTIGVFSGKISFLKSSSILNSPSGSLLKGFSRSVSVEIPNDLNFLFSVVFGTLLGINLYENVASKCL